MVGAYLAFIFRPLMDKVQLCYSPKIEQSVQAIFRLAFFVHLAFIVQRRDACHVQRTRKIFRGGGGTPPEEANDKATQFVKQHQLTLREVEVLHLLVMGKSNAQIANALSLSKKCIEHHIHNLYAKLGVKKRANAVYCAMNEGFVTKD